MRPPVVYLLLALAILLIGVTAARGFWESQEMAAYDWLMRTRPPQPTSPDIVIIEIADDTLKSLGRWPLPRNYHAALIKALTDSGCRMIIFDVMFSEPGAQDPLLAEAMRASGRVYLPCAFKLGDKSQRQAEAPVSQEIVGGVAEALRPVVAGIGHINIFVDSDGKVRRLPLWVRQADRLFPSLGFLAAAKCLGYPLEKMDLEKGRVLPEGMRRIPLDAEGGFWVNYPGPWTQTFQHFSYVDILKAYAARHSALQNGLQPWLDLRVFKDKICFVGLTATGTTDLRANPFDAVYPMIGTQASVCDSILRSSFIRRRQPLAAALIAAGVFLVSLAICLKFAPLAAFLYSFLAACMYCAGVWCLFALRGMLLDLFFPLAIIAGVYAAVLLRKFFEEAQKRRVLEKELEIAASIQQSFLPPEPFRVRGATIRAFLKPAKFVGGDFYDVICLDESTFGILVADVSGKGVSAALIMAQAISLLRVLASGSRDPAQVLNFLNEHLCRLLKGRFVTASYVVVHVQEGYWEGACSGHLPLFFFNKAQDLVEELLPASGPPLGLTQNSSYATVKRQLHAGDKIFMFTDGWTEARNRRGKEFGQNHLKDIFFNGRRESVDDLLAHLQAHYDAFEGAACQHDDLTALMLEFTGISNS